MKKLILIAVMLFSITVGATDFNLNGIWQSKDTTYDKVILFNTSDEKYNFINFSFIEQDEMNEEVLYSTDDYIKTKIHNPKNGWTVFVYYTVIDENTLLAKFSGDAVADLVYKLKKI